MKKPSSVFIDFLDKTLGEVVVGRRQTWWRAAIMNPVGMALIEGEGDTRKDALDDLAARAKMLREVILRAEKHIKSGKVTPCDW